MTTWSDEEIQEKLDELVDLSSEELAAMVPPPALARVEEHLDLHRRLKGLESPAPLPPDFAVRIAEESGVLRPPSSRIENWSAGVVIGLSGVVGIVVLTRGWAVFSEMIASSTLAAGFRGDILAAVAAGCGAFILGLLLDRQLSRLR